MTERKPAGQSWESWREELIRLAREERRRRPPNSPGPLDANTIVAQWLKVRQEAP
jgi:hypothetical protein